MNKTFLKIGAGCSALAITAMSAFAAGEVATIPTLSCDVSQYITSAITLLAGVVGVAVGGYVAFLVVRKGLRWLGTALR